METSQPLSIESFSYSWLVNLKPSLESLDGSLRASFDASDETSSFIEMDPRMPPSKRFLLRKNSKDFKFDFPTSDSSLTVVHADELFSNGHLMPFFVDSMKVDMQKGSENSGHESSQQLHPASSSASVLPRKKSSVLPAAGSPRSHRSLMRCRRLSKRLLQKYLDFLMPVYRRLRGHKKSSKTETVDKLDKRVHSLQTVRSWMYSSDSSPRISVAYSADDWRRSCDSESIYEAVLHCKRSIEN